METVIILVTCPPDKAESMALELVERKVAACVNVLPAVKSIYRWEGKICNEPESLLLIKSAESVLAKLQTTIKEFHPYDVPEFVVIKPKDVEARYASWLRDSLL